MVAGASEISAATLGADSNSMRGCAIQGRDRRAAACHFPKTVQPWEGNRGELSESLAEPERTSSGARRRITTATIAATCVARPSADKSTMTGDTMETKHVSTTIKSARRFISWELAIATALCPTLNPMPSPTPRSIPRSWLVSADIRSLQRDKADLGAKKHNWNSAISASSTDNERGFGNDRAKRSSERIEASTGYEDPGQVA